jgi:hypothetical protein
MLSASMSARTACGASIPRPRIVSMYGAMASFMRSANSALARIGSMPARICSSRW